MKRASITAFLLLPTLGFATVTFDFVPIGNPGNSPDVNGFGSVANKYYISTSQVKNGQLIEFLNAKFESSPGLQGSFAWWEYSGSPIVRDPVSGTFSAPGQEGTAAWISSPGTAIRFMNWLHNGQGDGDTENGAYAFTSNLALNGYTIAVRQEGASFFLPSLDEWYKAAYLQTVGMISESPVEWTETVLFGDMYEQIFGPTGDNDYYFMSERIASPTSLESFRYEYFLTPGASFRVASSIPSGGPSHAIPEVGISASLFGLISIGLFARRR